MKGVLIVLFAMFCSNLFSQSIIVLPDSVIRYDTIVVQTSQPPFILIADSFLYHKVLANYDTINYIEQVDTIVLTSPFPPYSSRDSIIRRKILIVNDSIDYDYEYDTVSYRQTFPPYELIDSIFLKKIQRKN
jgi:hypothetical protein